MSIVKISALPTLAALADADQIPVVHLGVTKKVTALHIQDYVLGNLTVENVTLGTSVPGGNIKLGVDLVPVTDNTISLGSADKRWESVHIGPGTLFIQDITLGTNAAITVNNGVLKIDGANQLQVGQLKFINNTIESTDEATNIEIGLLTSTADIIMNRDVVMGTGKTFTGNILGSASSVTNGVYTTDTASVTNTMLAGSIANNKLSNSSVTVGSTSIALGATSTALAGMTNITFAAGTDTVAPIKLTSGALLTAPAAGAIEYDGHVIYATPNLTTRGMIDTKMVYYNTNIVALASNSNQQSLLGLTNGLAVTYAARYKFKIAFTARTTADNVNLFFALGGTATYFRGNYRATVGKGSYGPGMMPATVVEVTGSADGQVKNTINISQGGVGGTYFDTVIEGIVDVQYSGYIKPIVLFSPAPGGGSFIVANAFMEIYPIGDANVSNLTTSIGNWS